MQWHSKKESAPKTVDVSQLPPGTLVEVVTQNSTYWLCTLDITTTEGNWVTGISVMTNTAVGRFPYSPAQMGVMRTIKENHHLMISFHDGVIEADHGEGPSMYQASRVRTVKVIK